MNKVITFGEIMLRLGAPDYLRLTQCDQLDVSFAGAEANVAVSLSNYGIPTDFITSLPINPIADKCIKELLSYKVGTEKIVRSGSRIGILYLETGSNVRPSRVFYDREYSSFATMSPQVLNWQEILKDAQWLHWTGITPALSESTAEICRQSIKTANAMGITVSCDINYRENLWNYGKKASEVMPELVAGCDIILGNEEDCEKVFGIKAQDFDANRANGNIEQSTFISVCKQMMKKFPRCKKMAITLRGAVNANHNTWGGILYDGENLFQSQRYDITDIVDRVGGGDSFMGGLIYGLITYPDDNQKALEFATAASCLKHTIKGDFNQVSINEIENLMKGLSNGRVQR